MPDKSPKERIVELKNELAKLSDKVTATQWVYLKGGVMNDSEALHWLGIDDGLAKRIAASTVTRLTHHIDEALEQDDGVIEIGTTDLPRGAIGYIDVSSFDKTRGGENPDQENRLHDLLTSFPAPSTEKLLGNDLKTHASRITLTAASIPLGSDDNPSRLVSICRQGGSTFMRSRSIWMRLIDEGALTEVQDIFELRDDTDLFVWDGTIWVLHERNFENTLGFNELTKARANDALDKIIKKLDFEDPDALRSGILAGKRASRIAAQLAGEPYLDNLTNENFLSYCSAQSLSGWEVGQNGKIQLESNSSTVVTRLLDAVSQNYFTGGIDGGSFKATNKVRRT